MFVPGSEIWDITSTAVGVGYSLSGYSKYTVNT